jgi:hypothetical protein
MPGVRELPPQPHVEYRAFIDPSGGAADSFTAAVSHRQGETILVDAVWEWKPPFSPFTVAGEIAGKFKAYGASRYSSERGLVERTTSIPHLRNVSPGHSPP